MEPQAWPLKDRFPTLTPACPLALTFFEVNLINEYVLRKFGQEISPTPHKSERYIFSSAWHSDLPEKRWS